MGQIAQRFKDLNIPFSKIGAIQDIRLQPKQKSILFVSAKDAARALPQLAQFPQRSSLYSILLSPGGDLGMSG